MRKTKRIFTLVLSLLMVSIMSIQTLAFIKTDPDEYYNPLDPELEAFLEKYDYIFRENTMESIEAQFEAFIERLHRMMHEYVEETGGVLCDPNYIMTTYDLYEESRRHSPEVEEIIKAVCDYCGSKLSVSFDYITEYKPCIQHQFCQIRYYYKVTLTMCSWLQCPKPTIIITKELLSTTHVMTQ